MSDNVKTSIGALIIVAIVAGLCWWEVATWKECRATNSFWYCVKVLG